MSDDPNDIRHPPPPLDIRHPPPPVPPTPGTALYIPPGALVGASEMQRRAIGRAELLFAATVCRAAAGAYAEIARILGESEKNLNDT